jgi:hypothetical protein
VKAHDHEVTSRTQIRRSELTNDQDVRREISLIHAVRSEDEAERDGPAEIDDTGGGDIAALLELGRVLLCARHRERGLCIESKSEDDEQREQQPAHAISV